MAIELLIPFIRLTKFFLVKKLKIILDTSFTNDPYKTKKSSSHAYKEVYSGE